VATEVTMPQMGADMTEGTLVRWLKQVGDQVNRGDIIAEIETDKATVELEAYDSGIMAQHSVKEGETVPVGDVIALLAAEGESVPDNVAHKPPAETPPRRMIEEPQPIAQATTQTTTASTTEVASAEKAPPPPRGAEEAHERIAPEGNGRVLEREAGARQRVSPVARRIASEAGLDLSAIRGTGPDGRVLRRDVEEALRAHKAGEAPAPPVRERELAPAAVAPEARPAAAPGEVEPLSRMRQAIARRMLMSKQQQPHYYLTLDIDMTEALEFRKQLNASASDDQRVSINDLIVKACALALDRHPKFNAEFTEQGLRQHKDIHIDIGIALDEGLIAPAILDVRGKGLGAIAADAKDLIERAKNGRLTADEYSAGTFTITNLGNFGVETLIGIINPPQAAILGVGSVMDQPVVRDGEVVVRKMMKVALSADHRVTDGAEGARFIKEIQGLLENPVSLAL